MKKCASKIQYSKTRINRNLVLIEKERMLRRNGSVVETVQSYFGLYFAIPTFRSWMKISFKGIVKLCVWKDRIEIHTSIRTTNILK